jgi:transcriptional regulator with XRE-family HTH domain
MEAKDYVIAMHAGGLTQAQIAARSGIPQPTISKIMRGEVRDVMSRNYRALQALHAELLTRDLTCRPPADAETQVATASTASDGAPCRMDA